MALCPPLPPRGPHVVRADRLAFSTPVPFCTPVREAGSGGGHWITLHAHGEEDEGTVHVFIGGGSGPGSGTISKGPKSLVGQHIAALASHPSVSRAQHHPVGHEPPGARLHPHYAEAAPKGAAEPTGPEAAKRPGKPYARLHGADQGTRAEQIGKALSDAQGAARQAKAPAPKAEGAQAPLSKAGIQDKVMRSQKLTADEKAFVQAGYKEPAEPNAPAAGPRPAHEHQPGDSGDLYKARNELQDAQRRYAQAKVEARTPAQHERVKLHQEMVRRLSKQVRDLEAGARPAAEQPAQPKKPSSEGYEALKRAFAEQQPHPQATPRFSAPEEEKPRDKVADAAVKSQQAQAELAAHRAKADRNPNPWAPHLSPPVGDAKDKELQEKATRAQLAHQAAQEQQQGTRAAQQTEGQRAHEKEMVRLKAETTPRAQPKPDVKPLAPARSPEHTAEAVQAQVEAHKQAVLGEHPDIAAHIARVKAQPESWQFNTRKNRMENPDGSPRLDAQEHEGWVKREALARLSPAERKAAGIPDRLAERQPKPAVPAPTTAQAAASRTPLSHARKLHLTPQEQATIRAERKPEQNPPQPLKATPPQQSNLLRDQASPSGKRRLQAPQRAPTPAPAQSPGAPASAPAAAASSGPASAAPPADAAHEDSLQHLRDHVVARNPVGHSVSPAHVMREMPGATRQEALAHLDALAQRGVLRQNAHHPNFYEVQPGHGTSGPGKGDAPSADIRRTATAEQPEPKEQPKAEQTRFGQGEHSGPVQHKPATSSDPIQPGRARPQGQLGLFGEHKPLEQPKPKGSATQQQMRAGQKSLFGSSFSNPHERTPEAAPTPRAQPSVAQPASQSQPQAPVPTAGQLYSMLHNRDMIYNAGQRLGQIAAHPSTPGEHKEHIEAALGHMKELGRMITNGYGRNHTGPERDAAHAHLLAAAPSLRAMQGTLGQPRAQEPELYHPGHVAQIVRAAQDKGFGAEQARYHNQIEAIAQGDMYRPTMPDGTPMSRQSAREAADRITALRGAPATHTRGKTVRESEVASPVPGFVAPLAAR